MANRSNVIIGAYVDPLLKAQLAKAAARAERSLSAEIRVALRRHLGVPEVGADVISGPWHEMTSHQWPEECERAVLGSILSAASYSADAGHRIYRRVEATGLDPEHFYRLSYGELYRVMGAMVEAGVPVDAVSIAAELDRRHADARVVHRLHVLAHEIVAFGTCERYAQIVAEAATRREIEARAA